MGVGWDGVGVWEFSLEFLEISWIILELVPRTKIDILNRQIKIFTVGLKKNNPEIMLNPPAQLGKNPMK